MSKTKEKFKKSRKVLKHSFRFIWLTISNGLKSLKSFGRSELDVLAGMKAANLQKLNQISKLVTFRQIGDADEPIRRV